MCDPIQYEKSQMTPAHEDSQQQRQRRLILSNECAENTYGIQSMGTFHCSQRYLTCPHNWQSQQNEQWQQQSISLGMHKNIRTEV